MEEVGPAWPKWPSWRNHGSPPRPSPRAPSASRLLSTPGRILRAIVALASRGRRAGMPRRRRSHLPFFGPARCSSSWRTSTCPRSPPSRSSGRPTARASAARKPTAPTPCGRPARRAARRPTWCWSTGRRRPRSPSPHGEPAHLGSAVARHHAFLRGQLPLPGRVGAAQPRVACSQGPACRHQAGPKVAHFTAFDLQEGMVVRNLHAHNCVGAAR